MDVAAGTCKRDHHSLVVRARVPTRASCFLSTNSLATSAAYYSEILLQYAALLRRTYCYSANRAALERYSRCARAEIDYGHVVHHKFLLTSLIHKCNPKRSYYSIAYCTTARGPMDYFFEGDGQQ